MKNKASSTIALLHIFIIFTTPLAQADTGIGFGFDQTTTQELVYSVNLATGTSTSIGVIDGLQYVATGSHSVDAASGASLMIGLKDGASEPYYLFLVIPKEKKSFSFSLPSSSARITYQQTFIHPTSGEMYLLSYNSNESVNQIHKISLNLTAGTLSLSKIGNITGLSAFSVGTPKFNSSGIIMIPSTSGGSGSNANISTTGELISFNTSNGTTSSVPLSSSFSDFTICSTGGSERYFGITNESTDSGVITYLDEVDSAGTILNQQQITDIYSALAGSLICSNNLLYLLGDNNSQSRGLYSHSIDSSDWTFTPISATSIKYIGLVSASISSNKSTLGIRSVTKFPIIKSSDIKLCATQNKKYFKKGSSSKIRNANSILAKFKFTKVAGKYRCTLKGSK